MVFHAVDACLRKGVIEQPSTLPVLSGFLHLKETPPAHVFIRRSLAEFAVEPVQLVHNVYSGKAELIRPDPNDWAILLMEFVDGSCAITREIDGENPFARKLGEQRAWDAAKGRKQEPVKSLAQNSVARQGRRGEEQGASTLTLEKQ